MKPIIIVLGLVLDLTIVPMTNAQSRLTALEGGIPPAVSGAGPGLTLGATTTNSQVLTFTSPASGPTPTTYQSRYALADSGAWVNGPSVSASPVTVAGMAENTNYNYDIVSVNDAVGPGGLSSMVTKRTSASFTPSPAWTSIPPATQIVMDDNGGVVTVANGAPIRLSGSIITAEKNDTGRIFQESNDPSLANLPGGVSSSHPKPTIPGNSAPKQRLMSYLQSISGNHVLSGQTTHSDNQEYNADTTALGFPVAVAIYEPYLHQWAHNYIYDPSFVDKAIAQWNAGGIVGVSMIIPNPAGGGSAEDGNPVNAEQVLTPGTAQYNRLIAFLNQTATDILIPLKNAGVPLLFRYMMEMDGSWFWWGDVTLGGFGRFNGLQQTRLYRLIHDYFVVTRGLDNLLFTFAINGGPGSYTYPGDDLVDIVSVDVYTNNPSGYVGIYNQLRAQASSKLIAFSEWGAGTPSANNPSFNTQTLIDAIKSQMPRICYVAAWAGWGWSLETNARGGLTDSYVVNRAQVVLPKRR
jgi:mannan endo-1,4-beta-mannosidase